MRSDNRVRIILAKWGGPELAAGIAPGAIFAPTILPMRTLEMYDVYNCYPKDPIAGAATMNTLGDQFITLIFNSISSVTALILQSLTNAMIESFLIPLVNSIAVALGLTPAA